MERKFMNYIENNEIWEKVYEDHTPTPASKPGSPWIEVFQYKARPMCYKIVARMNSSASVTFDAMCDLDRRSDWDPMCVEARVLEEVKALPGTTVQYIRTKAVWPTASRDTVVLGTIKELEDGRLFMVNASVEHPSMPERVKEKIVRMETAVAGHIITPEEGFLSCRLVQVLDADLKGWIPDKVIQMGRQSLFFLCLFIPFSIMTMHTLLSHAPLMWILFFCSHSLDQSCTGWSACSQCLNP